MSQVRIVHKKRSRASWPVIGFILAVALAILAWFIAPPTIDFLKRELPQFSTIGLTAIQLRIVVTVILFILMGALVALTIALLSPRHMIEVREDELAKERQGIQRDRRRAKDLQRKVNQELRKGK